MSAVGGDPKQAMANPGTGIDGPGAKTAQLRESYLVLRSDINSRHSFVSPKIPKSRGPELIFFLVNVSTHPRRGLLSTCSLVRRASSSRLVNHDVKILASQR